MASPSHLAHNIRAARLARGHTQESLARCLNITVRAVGQWESGATTPTRRNLEGLAVELKREPAWFYTACDDEPVAA